MHFIDECTLVVRAGDGGNGCASFRREAHQPRGGPSGGDGGHGGSVVFVADLQLTTLLDVAYKKEYQAAHGQAGQGRDRYGKSGTDLLIPIPVGTQIQDEHHHLLADLHTAGQTYVAARGGTGGRGNIHFATSTNQAPHHAEPGTPGEHKTLHLELSLLADVGLLGFPNVGKSTLLRRISDARPKVANYPFTTLIPQLGVVRLPLDHPRPTRSLVLADLPGLIEGAHHGKGLGHQFLRHIRRTAVLIHLVSCMDDQSPWQAYQTLNHELAQYDAVLSQRPQVVVLSKMDLPEVKEQFPHWQRIFDENGLSLYGISAATGEGLSAVLEKAYRHVHQPI